MRVLPLFAVSLVTLALLGMAERAEAYPEEYTQRPQTLPSGMFEIGAGAVVDLSSGRPVSGGLQTLVRWGAADGFELDLAADVYFRDHLTDRRTALSARGILWHSSEASLSLEGGLDVHVIEQIGGKEAVGGGLASFAGVGFYAQVAKPVAMRARVGIMNPLLFRDKLSDVATFSLEPSWNIVSPFAVFLNIDVATPIDRVDGSVGSLGAGCLYTLDNRFDFGAAVAVPGLVSKSGLSADARVVSAFVRWRLDAR